MLKQFIKDTPFGVSIFLMALAIGLIIMIAPIGGNKALIVRSGSMQPVIKTGDLVVIKPQTNYKVGDIIAYKDPQKASVNITHRIVGEEIKNGQKFYKTRGDVNNTNDTNLVPQTNIIGKADYGIKSVGKIFAYAKTKTGFLTLIAIPAFFVILFEISNIIKELKKSKEHPVAAIYKATLKHIYHNYGQPMGVSHPSASFKSLFKVNPRTILPVLAALLIIGNTFAFFSDTDTSTSNVFSAASTFPTPTPSPSIGSVLINEVYYDPDAGHMQGGNPDENNFEWVELYNSGSSTVNLKNWKIVDNSGTERTVSTSNRDLAPGQFAILAKAANTFTLWSIPSEAEQIPLGEIFGNGLANTDDRVILKNDVGNIIDQMSWGTDTTAFTPAATDVAQGHSLERNPDGFDTNAADDFVDRNPPTPGT